MEWRASVVVAAPAEVVWRVLSEVEAWRLTELVEGRSACSSVPCQAV